MPADLPPLPTFDDHPMHQASRTRTAGFVPLWLAVACAVLLAACTPAETSAGDGSPQVVATTSILGDLVTSIARDRVDVVVLMPPGVDPHDWSPAPSDVERLLSADLVIANGLGLEASVADVLGQVDRARLLEVAPLLEPLPLADEPGSLDPHVWLDPVRMAVAARLVGEALAAVAEAPTLAASGAARAAELEDLDEELRDQLAGIPADRRQLVTGHEALAYFARRYDLDVVGVVVTGGSTEAEADARHLAELVDVVRDTGVRVVFVDAFSSSRVADALAGEVDGVTVVPLTTDALGVEGSDTGTYDGLLRQIAGTISGALDEAGD